MTAAVKQAVESAKEQVQECDEHSIESGTRCHNRECELARALLQVYREPVTPIPGKMKDDYDTCRCGEELVAENYCGKCGAPIIWKAVTGKAPNV